MQGKVEICGVNTGKLTTLSQAEMNRLLRLARDGDEDARQKLIEGNLRLVLSVIQRFDKRGESPDDLFQVGCIGLIKAISNFDPDKQVRFSTHGVPMIKERRGNPKGVSMTTRKQALQRAIEHLSRFPEYAEEVRLLEEICDELPLIHWSDRSIRDTVEQFILDNGRPPTASDFKKAGMPPHTVIQSKYKMPLSRWLDENYPTPKLSAEERKAEYTRAFREDYRRVRPRSQYEFNQRKRPETRSWQTVAAYHNTRSWRKLLEKLDLPLYFDRKRDHIPANLKVILHSDYDFRDESDK